jgi:hypothetical protein
MKLNISLSAKGKSDKAKILALLGKLVDFNERPLKENIWPFKEEAAYYYVKSPSTIVVSIYPSDSSVLINDKILKEYEYDKDLNSFILGIEKIGIRKVPKPKKRKPSTTYYD